MRISIEKASDGTFIIEVPAKKKEDAKGNSVYKEDLKYTADTEEEALKVIAKALKEITVPKDDYDIAITEAMKER